LTTLRSLSRKVPEKSRVRHPGFTLLTSGTRLDAEELSGARGQR
jgi:hypothetical protein